MATVGETLRRNTRFSIFAYLVSEGTRFLLVPVVIHFIHLDGYTLVRIAFTFFGFFALYSFGVHGAYVKYTAECRLSGDDEKLSALLSVGVMFCALVGGVTFAVVAWQREAIASLMKPDSLHPEDLEFMIVYVSAIALVCVVFGVYRSVLTGIQRMDVTNSCVIVFNIVQVVLVVALLYAGYGVRMVVVVYGIALAGPFLLMGIYVKRLLPNVRIRLSAIRRDAWRPMLNLGGRMQVLGVVALLAVSIDAVVLFRYFPEAFTGAYLVARQFSTRIQTIPMLGFGALAPASADLFAREAHETVTAVYKTAQRITVVVTAYLFMFLIVNGDLMLVAYLGPEQYSDVAWRALVALCIATTVHTVTGPGSSMLRGAGRPELEIVYQALTVALFAILVYAAIAVPDVLPNDWGVLLAMPVALALSSAVFLVLANRQFGTPALFPFGETLLPVLGGLVAAALLRGGLMLMPLDASESRWLALGAVAVLGALYTVIYVLLGWYLPGLTPGDRDQLVRLAPYGPSVREWLAPKPAGEQ